jgi:hypothetical protein
MSSSVRSSQWVRPSLRVGNGSEACHIDAGPKKPTPGQATGQRSQTVELNASVPLPMIGPREPLRGI